jgi:hypothetical protein
MRSRTGLLRVMPRRYARPIAASEIVRRGIRAGNFNTNRLRLRLSDCFRVRPALS